MPRRDLNGLPYDSNCWVFGITPPLDEKKEATLVRRIDEFLANWSAHGSPIDAGRDVIEGTFLVVAADPNCERCGSSIDALFRTVQQIERELGVAMMDPTRIFFRHGDGRIDSMPRAQFREQGDAHTIVFDTTAHTLGEIRSGGFERKAELSWHRDLLRKAV